MLQGDILHYMVVTYGLQHAVGPSGTVRDLLRDLYNQVEEEHQRLQYFH